MPLAMYAGMLLSNHFEIKPPIVGPIMKANVNDALKCDKTLILSSSVVMLVMAALDIVIVCLTRPTITLLSTTPHTHPAL
eukprot:CAMPEP_0172020098 /NCGR_PEP_ID=MMETSP1041-20130122/13008_1 /TAXON_ID=464988 /ORGANISM="Hemiselmis andersenii, Strain CCMP439" /LENGTH=79 /DNA_ID=CAMNT_0012675355 /DNA_START=148 /DNA_END=387 /DNA_ORIENTATION=+